MTVKHESARWTTSESPLTAATALEPVRRRLRRDAEDQAAHLRAAARRQAADIVQQAHRDAADALAGAQAVADATATPVAAAELREARDAARSQVLAAQRAAFDELRSRVRDGIAALTGQPGYDRLLREITRRAGQAAGPGAELTAAPDGGVVARGRGVVVDCSLARLADLAVTELGPAITELWAQ
jgi:vacuolar-type H+-ATPase subunit E/Vma4